jgi:metacaspase-1
MVLDLDFWDSENCFLKLKDKIMCKKFWNLLFHHQDPEPDPIIATKRRALLFGINKYGGGNDLQGCINDIDDVKTKLNKEFPDFEILMFKDSQVTCKTFFDTIKQSLQVMQPGDVLYIHYSGHGTQIPSSLETNGYHEALYLIDGPFIDDQVQTLQELTPAGAIVVAKFDSCFSGDMLREFNGNPMYLKNRFMPMPGVKIRHKVMNKIIGAKTAALKWIVFSGCSEEQTSADAYFNGRYNGAFTYFDIKSYSPSSIYKSEIEVLHDYLPSGDYEQNPTLDGDSVKFNRIVFQ